jgi:hypothetical protein
MSLSRPRAVVTVADRRLTAAEAGLLRVEVRLGVDGAHDWAHLLVWPTSKLKDTAPGATVTVALGEDGGEADVLAGEITDVAAGPDGLALEVLAATVALSRARVSQTYLDQSVADIVRDLASSVPIDDVQCDTQLKYYAVDDRSAVWDHLRALAALMGADLGCSAAGGFRFVPPRTGTADVELRYGADLVAWGAGPQPQPKFSTVAAHGAASEEGSEKWHWLLRSPSPSGSGDAGTLVLGALHTKDAADDVSRALEDAAGRAAVGGAVTIVGNPDLRPGDLVSLVDLPQGDPGTLRVLAVRHLLDPRTGFATSLAVEGAGS